MTRSMLQKRETQSGFSLIELMIVVAVIAILGAIAVPMYRGYVAKAKVDAATAVLQQFDVLLEAFRAENGSYPPTGTYDYKEDNGGTPTVSTILTHLPDFTASTEGSGAILYDYKLVIANSGSATESATATATAVAARGGVAGVPVLTFD